MKLLRLLAGCTVNNHQYNEEIRLKVYIKVSSIISWNERVLRLTEENVKF
jgi:hypothetical protein